MTHLAARRLENLTQEVARKSLDGTITHNWMDEVETEAAQLRIQIKNQKAALGLVGSASPAEYGIDGNPGDANYGYSSGAGVQWKSFGLPNSELHPQVPAPSMDLSNEQIGSLFDAAKAGAKGYKVQIGHKDFASSMRTKTPGAPLAESGLNIQLPAIQIPGQYGQYGQPYEPFRLLANIPTVAMTGPGAAYLSWAGNTNNAARVPGGQPKPSLGPIITENFIKPMKLAAAVEGTMEILQDHSEFAQWLRTGLQQNVINEESLYLIQANASGGPTASEFNGLLATSGTQAQDATGLTFPDALSMAYVKLRTGSAFCQPRRRCAPNRTPAHTFSTSTAVPERSISRMSSTYSAFGLSHRLSALTARRSLCLDRAVRRSAGSAWAWRLCTTRTAAPPTPVRISGAPTSTAGAARSASACQSRGPRRSASSPTCPPDVRRPIRRLRPNR
jgi:hypothetical protein